MLSFTKSCVNFDNYPDTQTNENQPMNSGVSYFTSSLFISASFFKNSNTDNPYLAW